MDQQFESEECENKKTDAMDIMELTNERYEELLLEEIESKNMNINGGWIIIVFK